MLTLYSYPPLFGVADNNGYGLKVFAVLRLTGVPFQHDHIFDVSKAPRGQLPYIVDDSEIIGDSETIITHLIGKHRLTIDGALTPAQRGINLLITRTLDDLYWVMSYSRWKDERYWPAFRDALLREHPSLTEGGLLKAKAFNAQRYHYQGIGRYEPDAAMARGLPISARSPASFPNAAMCMARRRAASTPASMPSSPTSTSTTSTRRSSNSWSRTTTSCGTAAPFMQL